jgi:hypothetical protein
MDLVAVGVVQRVRVMEIDAVSSPAQKASALMNLIRAQLEVYVDCTV